MRVRCEMTGGMLAVSVAGIVRQARQHMEDIVSKRIPTIEDVFPIGGFGI